MYYIYTIYIIYIYIYIYTYIYIYILYNFEFDKTISLFEALFSVLANLHTITYKK